MVDPDRLSAAYETARCDLLAESAPGGHWIGRLSSSPLATAVAISALSIVERHAPTARGRYADESRECRLSELIMTGIHWLADRQNADGGWGDAEHAPSNVAATMAVRAAFSLTAVPADHPGLLERADAYLKQQGGARTLARRYAAHQTLISAVMANAALANLISWRRVPLAHFELTCCQSLITRWLGRPSVASASESTAPEIATALVRFAHRRSWNPIARLLHRRTLADNLRTIADQQASDGSFLESAPMTSFVVMCLAASGQADHAVVRQGVEYLLSSVRPEGSWPIAAEMAVRNTSLAIGALASAGEDLSEVACFDWLLGCQRTRTQAGTEVGGWSWTNRAGGVVNTLDTSAALLALAAGRDCLPAERRGAFERSAVRGVEWLLAAQNGDGGWPACGGALGRNGDDDSRCDTTALALRALAAWRGTFTKVSDHTHELHTYRGDRVAGAIDGGLRYLTSHQNSDGSWSQQSRVPPSDVAHDRAIFATAQVLSAFRDLARLSHPAVTKGLDWLVTKKQGAGAWGASISSAPDGVSATVEETAWAAGALASCGRTPTHEGAAEAGLAWLIDAVEANRHQTSAPVGRTLAGLWYDEKLTPLVGTVAALGRQIRQARIAGQTRAVVQATRP